MNIKSVWVFYPEVQVKSSLWSLKRDVWVDGPVMPENLIRGQPCATALNDTVVIFINLHIDLYTYTDMLAYDFSKDVWYPIFKPASFSGYFNLLCTCASMHDKTYRL